MKSYQKYVLFLLAVLIMLTGCGGGAGTEEQASATLWIVTEKTNADGMNEQVNQVIAAFQEDHPEITIQLDILPQEENERELTIQKLRTQLMAGNGPDILLLPTVCARIFNYSWTLNEAETISSRSSPLLLDVTQSMRTGIFLDISAFYDNDEALGKEALQQTIMDAGTLGDARYVLPLRYDFPAVYIQDAGVEALGIDPETLEEGILPLLEAVVSAGDSLLASGAVPSFCRIGDVLTLLPAAVDYENMQITLEPETLAEFLALYQQAEAVAAGNDSGRDAPWVWDYVDPTDIVYYTDEQGKQKYYLATHDAFPSTIPVAASTMSKAVNAAAINKSEHGGYRMAPLRGTDGQLTAWVTYYGAITAGCDYPEEAYDFLRRFLLEENQWEQNRTLKKASWGGLTWKNYAIEDGWPVRYKGFAEDFWNDLHRELSMSSTAPARRVRSIKLTDEDIPLLDAEIDRVYFGNAVETEIAEYIRGMNDDETGEPLSTAHAEAAEEFVNTLEWNLLEG